MDEEDIEDIELSNLCKKCHLYRIIPSISMYGPYNIKGLKEGKHYNWCRY